MGPSIVNKKTGFRRTPRNNVPCQGAPNVGKAELTLDTQITISVHSPLKISCPT